jgi:hypothetical protein
MVASTVAEPVLRAVFYEDFWKAVQEKRLVALLTGAA